MVYFCGEKYLLKSNQDEGGIKERVNTRSGKASGVSYYQGNISRIDRKKSIKPFDVSDSVVFCPVPTVPSAFADRERKNADKNNKIRMNLLLVGKCYPQILSR